MDPPKQRPPHGCCSPAVHGEMDVGKNWSFPCCPLVRLQVCCLFLSQGSAQAFVLPHCPHRPSHTHRARSCRKPVLFPSQPIPGSLPVAQTMARFHTETQLLWKEARREAENTRCVQQTHTHNTEHSDRDGGLCTGDGSTELGVSWLGREGLLCLVQAKPHLPWPCASRLLR